MDSIFKFKKFDIIHNEEVWKVGTDGVLLGAVSDYDNAKNILDIGTGTGLLALMVAQKTEAQIDAIDINSCACRLANINVNNSKWKDRISVVNIAVQQFFPDKKYDRIVTNPPYFQTGQVAPNKNRAIARHSTELNYNDLAESAARLLTDDGIFMIIYPPKEMTIFEKIANTKHLFVLKTFFIYPKIDYACIRIVNFLSKKMTQKIDTEHIIIENQKRHDYSDQYRNLTKDYYLNSADKL
jgi:tRNA1Val (adenine37-N6)-methyltransferase